MDEIKEIVRNRQIVVVDLETSGVDKDRDYILELGAVKLEQGKIADEYSSLVRCPQMKTLPKEIEYFVGIRFDDLVTAPHIDDVLKRFYEFAKGCVLVGHNLSFDFAFLRSFGSRCGACFDEFEKSAIDTLALAKGVLGEKIANCKIDTLAKYFDIEYAPFRALDYAKTTAKVLLKLINDKEN